MDANGQVFRHNRATTGTHLRCASWVDQHDTATSILSFVRGILDELSPSHIGNIAVDDLAAVRLHLLNLKVFKHDQTIAIDQFAALLMCKVRSAISRALVGVVQCTQHFPTCLTALW